MQKATKNRKTKLQKLHSRTRQPQNRNPLQVKSKSTTCWLIWFLQKQVQLSDASRQYIHERNTKPLNSNSTTLSPKRSAPTAQPKLWPLIKLFQLRTFSKIIDCWHYFPQIDFKIIQLPSPNATKTKLSVNGLEQVTSPKRPSIVILTFPTFEWNHGLPKIITWNLIEKCRKG